MEITWGCMKKNITGYKDFMIHEIRLLFYIINNMQKIEILVKIMEKQNQKTKLKNNMEEEYYEYEFMLNEEDELIAETGNLEDEEFDKLISRF